jgi:putative redox protein
LAGNVWVTEIIFLSNVQESIMSSEWKEVVAEWCSEMAFVGRNETGGSVQMGTLAGQPGVSPMEMLLLGVAGCTGMDVVSILQKKQQDLKRFEVRVRGKRADDYPKVYKEIEIFYHLWGEAIDPTAVERAIQLSEEKYCSASAMLRAAAEIRSEYVIHAQIDQPV